MSLPGMLSSLELLESRIAPAGIVTIEATEFGYKITGDLEANDLYISDSGSALTIEPRNGTQILNKTVAGSPLTSTSVDLSLSSNVTGGRFGSDLEINLGGGADILFLQALTLPGNLSVNMGPRDSSSATQDTLDINGLFAARNVDLVASQGTVTILENLYVGLDLSITSRVDTFLAEVGSFYVGRDLTIEASLQSDSNTFRLETVSFGVYDDFTFIGHVTAENLPSDAVEIFGNNVAIGGDLRVSNGVKNLAEGRATLQLGGPSVDIGGKLIAENFSRAAGDSLELQIHGAVVRVNDRFSATSTSPAPSDVSVNGGVVIIDGSVNARLLKGGGSLAISADHLTVFGNVNFLSKGTGNLTLSGDGNVFGKVSASLGAGSGVVNVSGAPGGDQLFLSGLTVTSPAKLPLDASAVTLEVADVAVIGKMSVSLGRGSDAVYMDDVLVTGRTKISMGDGDDYVALHTEGAGASQFRGGLSVLLGNGDDELVLGKTGAFDPNTALSIYGPMSFNGGAGTDSQPSIDGRNIKFLKSFTNRLEITPVFRAFEI